MNLNILRMRNAVESAYKKPNIALAMLLVLVPSVLSLIGYALVGATVDYGKFFINWVALEYVRFFIVAVIFLVFALLLGVGDSTKKFPGIVSALSLLKVVQVAFVVLSLVTMPLLFQPAFMQTVGRVMRGEAEFSEINVTFTYLQQQGLVNMPLFYLGGVIAIVLTIFSLVLYYKIVAGLYRQGIIVNLVLAAVLWVIVGIIQSMLGIW